MGGRATQSGSHPGRGLSTPLEPSNFSFWNRLAPLRFSVLLILLSVWIPFSSAQATPFSIARIHYDGGGDWYADPSSLPNLMEFLESSSGIQTSGEEVVVRLDDESFFQYPLLYLTGHGNLRFSDEQAARLRLYLEHGGFLLVDDNYGLDKAFRRELRKVFPEKELGLVPFSHPLYSNWFDYGIGLPKIHEHDGKPPAGYGIFHEDRLVVFYTHECDLGDGWEDARVHQDSPELRRRALEMGANIVFYVLGVWE
jgi:hypothetical protein